MIIQYDGQDYEVEGRYIEKVPGRMYTANGDGWPDEPSDFEIESVVLLDHKEDATPINIDVTDTMADDDDFINACLEHYETYYYD